MDKQFEQAAGKASAPIVARNAVLTCDTCHGGSGFQDYICPTCNGTGKSATPAKPEPAVEDVPDAEVLIKWINAGAFGMESAHNRRTMCDHVRRLAAPVAQPLAPSDWEAGHEDCDGNALAVMRQDELALAADFIRHDALQSARIDGKDISRQQMMSRLITASSHPRAQPLAPSGAVQFQQRVQPWMMACFGEMIAADIIERNHRFLEEALELVQSCGCAADEAHQLVDYVFGRPVGEKSQEVGGVMVTLAALCLAQGLDMHKSGEIELARIWTKVEQIRAKQAAKPQFGPLPGPSAEQSPIVLAAALNREQISEIAVAVMQPKHCRFFMQQVDRSLAAGQPLAGQDVDRDALIACLGDDAAKLREANPDDEMAQTMDEAAALLETDGVEAALTGMALAGQDVRVATGSEVIAKHAEKDDFVCSTPMGYAQFLAWAIWGKHYKVASPDFTIMADLCGVLSQIDNMTCGLTLAAPSPVNPKQEQ